MWSFKKRGEHKHTPINISFQRKQMKPNTYIQLIQLRLTSTIVKWQMCDMHNRKKMMVINIVLNKINTSVALLDYKYSI